MYPNRAIIFTEQYERKTEYEQQLFELSKLLKTLDIIVTGIQIVNEEAVMEITKYLKNYLIFIFSTENKLALSILSKIFGNNLCTTNHLIFGSNAENESKMLLPVSSKLFQLKNSSSCLSSFCINMENIFILPTEQKLLKTMIKNVVVPFLTFRNRENIVKGYTIQCKQNGFESFPKEMLSNIEKNVNVVKYCSVQNGTCEHNIIIYSSNFSALAKSISVFKSIIPKQLILNEYLDKSFWEIINPMKTEKYVIDSIKILRECFEKYDPDKTFLSFNGGKDCTVLLYLTLYVLHTMYPNRKEKLLCLYIQSEHPFVEVEEFIEQCTVVYPIELITIRKSVKEGLIELLQKRPELTTCIMGTRRTDPYAATLKPFQMCDPGWPKILRVSPILEWKYSEIWKFLLNCKIPYCYLYDMGYTSLGSLKNTIPNPDLKIDTASGNYNYLPAYKLIDESKERHGRLQ